MLDRELFHAYAQSDDQGAFKTLVDRHLPLIYGLAQRELRNRSLAEEVCQAALCQLAKAARQGQDILSIPAWLYRVTQRQILQTMRAEKRRLHREQEAVLRDSLDREGDALGQEMALAMREALATLNSTERNVLFLRYYDGHTAEEIGERCGIGAKAAQKRVERAIERLRTLVKRRGLALPASMLSASLLTSDAMEPPIDFASSVADKVLHSSTIDVGGSKLTAMLSSTPIAVAIGTALVGLIVTTFVLKRPLALNNSAASSSAANPAIETVGGPGVTSALSRASNRGLAVDDIEGIYRLPEDERDPALQRLVTHLRQSHEDSYFQDLFTRWTRLDPPRNARAITTLLESSPNVGETQIATLTAKLSIPIQAWMSNDPGDAKTWALLLPRALAAERPAFEAVLKVLAERNLQEAYAFLEQRTYHRDTAFQIIADALDQTDVSTALTWMTALPEQEAVTINEAASLQQEAGINKTQTWLALLPSLYTRDRQAVCQWLIGLPPNMRTTMAISKVVALWTHEAPGAAIDWAHALEDLKERQAALDAIANTWAKTAPDAALAWTLSLDASLQPWNMAAEALRGGWASAPWTEDPGTLQAQLGGWSQEPAASPVFFVAAAHLPTDSLSTWMLALPQNTNRDRVRQQLFYRLGQGNPAQGEEALSELPSPEEQRDAARWFGFGRQLSKDKKSYHAWRKTFAPNNPISEGAQIAEVDLMAAMAPDAAATKVLKQEPGAQRDRLLNRLIERTMRRSPEYAEQALAWCTEVWDPQLRQSLSDKAQAVRNGTFEPQTLKRAPRVPFHEQPLESLLGHLDIISRMPPKVRRTSGNSGISLIGRDLSKKQPQ